MTRAGRIHHGPDPACVLQVRLIAIDSITFHFRQDTQDMAQRARILAGLAQSLTRLAAYRRIAIVLMNQVTTKVSDGGQSQIIPALGALLKNLAVG